VIWNYTGDMQSDEGELFSVELAAGFSIYCGVAFGKWNLLDKHVQRATLRGAFCRSKPTSLILRVTGRIF